MLWIDQILFRINFKLLLWICFSSTRSPFSIGSPKNQSEKPIGCYAIFFPYSAKSLYWLVKLFYFRIESYSCKLAGHEKQLYKRFHSEAGAGPHDLQVLSAPQTALAVSPTGGYFTNHRCVELRKIKQSFTYESFDIQHFLFSCSVSGDEEGPLCDTISRKTLFYLIATLNASFHPDYDFSYARSEEFSREPSIQVYIFISIPYLMIVLKTN